MRKILIHGSGHKGTSWNETIKFMQDNKEILASLHTHLGIKDYFKS